MKTYCNRCLLPSDYLNISINDQGVCNYCESYEPINFLGIEKLKEDIQESLSRNKSKNYDCVVGFSGGRDSSYLLWFVVKILKLRPLAVFSDDMFIPEVTLQNIKNTCKILEVDLRAIKHDNLKRCIKHHLNAWIRRPVPESLVFINVGERIGYETLVELEAIKENVHLIFGGRTPVQASAAYKADLIKINNKGGKLAWILGYMKQVLLNPSLAANLFCLKTQYREFMVTKWKEKLVAKNDLTIMHPFFEHIHWEEKEIERILFEELKWLTPEGTNQTGRIGCEVDTIRQFLYYRTLGYNDLNVDLSGLVRDGQLTRSEAAQKLEDGLDIPEEYIESILTKAGVDAKSFLEKLDKKHPVKYRFNEKHI